MKIGLVCPYSIYKGGGVLSHISMLEKEYVARGHDVTIITPRPRNHEGKKPDNILFVGTSTDFKSPTHTTVQVSASVDVEEIESVVHENFDILHFHEPWIPMVSRQLLAQ